MQYALKMLDAQAAKIGGYLVVWGSPQQRDLQGEYFTPQSELGLDWYDQRPVLYHHGLDGTVKGEVIGVITSLKADDTGLWAEAQLDMRKRYVAAVLNLVEKGVLGWSSGSLPQLADVAADGWIRCWPIVEGSLTPTPAEPRFTEVSTIKAVYQSLGWDSQRLALDTPPPAVPGWTIKSAEPLTETLEDLSGKAGFAMTDGDEMPGKDDPSPTNDPPSTQAQSTEGTQMNLRDILMLFVQALMDTGAQVSEDQVNAAVAQIEQAVQGDAETSAQATEMMQTQKYTELGKLLKPHIEKVMKPILETAQAAAKANQAKLNEAAKGLAAAMIGEGGQSRIKGYQGANAAGTQPGSGPRQITLKSAKYGHMDPEDMSYFYMLMNAASHQERKRPWQPDNEFAREIVGKSVEAFEKGKLKFGDVKETAIAVKSLNQSMAALAIKSDELDYSTLAGYGDEWVPDLWASQIWERFRVDAMIGPLFQVVEMPSNPFELPVEGTDPTLYFVPETKNEDALTLDGSTSPIPDSKIGSGKVTLSAQKLALRVGFTEELVEDSIIPVINQYRTQAQKVMLRGIDKAILSGDTAASNNVNYDGGTPATNEVYKAFNGLRKAALVTASQGSDMGGVAPTMAAIRAARFLIPAARAIMPGDLAYIAHGEMYATLLNLNQIQTMDKYGPNAVILTGEVGKLDGSPVIVTDQLGLTASNGKVSSTGGNNTLGSLVVVHKPSWKVGYRRRVRISVDYLPYYDAYQLTATLRLAFVGIDSLGASVLYDVLV